MNVPKHGLLELGGGGGGGGGLFDVCFDVLLFEIGVNGLMT